MNQPNPFVLNLDPDVRALLVDLAKSRGTNITQLGRTAITRYLAEELPKEPQRKGRTS